jgi:hypothetical protein
MYTILALAVQEHELVMIIFPTNGNMCRAAKCRYCPVSVCIRKHEKAHIFSIYSYQRIVWDILTIKVNAPVFCVAAKITKNLPEVCGDLYCIRKG